MLSISSIVVFVLAVLAAAAADTTPPPINPHLCPSGDRLLVIANADTVHDTPPVAAEDPTVSNPDLSPAPPVEDPASPAPFGNLPDNVMQEIVGRADSFLSVMRWGEVCRQTRNAVDAIVRARFTELSVVRGLSREIYKILVATGAKTVIDLPHKLKVRGDPKLEKHAAQVLDRFLALTGLSRAELTRSTLMYLYRSVLTRLDH
ncbi:hypothetical protein CASFOL_027678 [Castilleja foliolosa]|uniref:F-box domain-containing protein n=1 Tax=Castilleja foliolosa TaxID=1961234 RepID=A0ABD3CGD3_9LAMI